MASKYKISRSHETGKGEFFCNSILIVELIKVAHSKNIPLNAKAVTSLNKGVNFHHIDMWIDYFSSVQSQKCYMGNVIVCALIYGVAHPHFRFS